MYLIASDWFQSLRYCGPTDYSNHMMGLIRLASIREDKHLIISCNLISHIPRKILCLLFTIFHRFQHRKKWLSKLILANYCILVNVYIFTWPYKYWKSRVFDNFTKFATLTVLVGYLFSFSPLSLIRFNP